MASPLILVANPGSASRKYGIFQGGSEKASLHIEYADTTLQAHLRVGGVTHDCNLHIDKLEDSASEIARLFHEYNVLSGNETISAVGLRVVAPSSFFLKDHIVTDEIVQTLSDLGHTAPLHIGATLAEYDSLSAEFPSARFVFVSDSAFHATKPDYAWNYGIQLSDSDKYDIKRFGYHGLSVESVVSQLRQAGKLASRMIVCHLGSGASVTAVYNGKSIDTSMGYSPLEGVIMSTRSGSIDYEAAIALKKHAELTDGELETYLYKHSGLLGLGGTADIRELLRRHEGGDHQATLALNTFLHSVHKQIGAMTTTMNGVDVLVFTGTAGERSAIIRKKIAAHLQHLDIHLDDEKNNMNEQPESLISIAQTARSKPIFVVTTNEARQIANRTATVVQHIKN